MKRVKNWRDKQANVELVAVSTGFYPSTTCQRGMSYTAHMPVCLSVSHKPNNTAR